MSSSVRMWLPSTSASAQDDDLVVADLVDVELLAEAGADGRDQGLDLVVLEHLVDAGPLDVEDLAPDRQDRLDAGVAGLGGRAAGGVALDDEQLGLVAGRGTSSRRACRACPRPRGRTCAGWRRGPGGPRCGPVAAAIAFLTIWLASVGCSSSQSPSFSLVARSTSERIETLPSLALVWPSNCGSRSCTEMMAVRPSRMSSPRRLSSFSLSRPLARAYLLTTLVRAFLKPSSCMPPSMVAMPLAKEWRPSCCSRCSTGTRPRPPGRPRPARSSRPA